MHAQFMLISALLAIVPTAVSAAPGLVHHKPAFSGFTTKEAEPVKLAVQEALPRAHEAIQGAWCYLQKHGEDPDPSQLQAYKKAFGTFDKDDYKTVYNHFRAKASDFDIEGQGNARNSLTYNWVEKGDQSKTKDKEERTAYTLPHQPGHNVYICPKFKTKSREDRAHAIVHETMHFPWLSAEGSRNLGANGNPLHEKEHYGKSKIADLAKKDSHYAIDNADSLASFAMSVGSDSCGSSKSNGASRSFVYKLSTSSL
ncbi:hypothetical protein HGRIS_006025 [Hohenbuehelia grisea]|uniref:Lysine-specific metallo-endopeptidase domain-containing protein n=1 Tax=Hohenbuehelia grisea TaxID=104357 RepID=A0ABR3K033_9AGAR